MGRGTFGELLRILEIKGETLPDSRRTGHNFLYPLTDVVKSAFGVFFFQHPSMLDYQRKMQDKHRRNNMASIFGVKQIPSDTQIRNLLDGIAPERFGSVFNESLRIADGHGVLDNFRVLDGGVLIALDGVWYHSSEKIHCKHCLHKTKVDKKTKEPITTYYHTVLAGTIVRPGKTEVLPVMGGFIRNEDGQDKQDCELKAMKRWISRYADEYKWLQPTFLGDDLFSNYPICQQIVESGHSFIFTCKPDSHPWLTETVNNSFLESKERKEWKGSYHMTYRYRWCNEVPIRDHRKTLLVNYVYLEIENSKSGRVTYRNSWITNKPVDEENVERIASCGRARWKIENEHNNVLKNHGYNLEHNFGHGEAHASEMFCLLNLLAFLFHGILFYADEQYRKARSLLGRRTEFFNCLRFALRYAFHEGWDAFLFFVLAEDEAPG
jgi:hypothetical protein